MGANSLLAPIHRECWEWKSNTFSVATRAVMYGNTSVFPIATSAWGTFYTMRENIWNLTLKKVLSEVLEDDAKTSPFICKYINTLQRHIWSTERIMQQRGCQQSEQITKQKSTQRRSKIWTSVLILFWPRFIFISWCQHLFPDTHESL